MGVTFIGNPFDQDEEYDDSDWDMNAVEEWILPPQELGFLEPLRTALIHLPAEEGTSSDSDEDYVPEEDEEEDFANALDPFFYGSNEDDDDEDAIEGEEDEEEEELDYVTYPVRSENASDTEKPSSPDVSNFEENSDTD